MMSEHLSPEQIENLGSYRLKGESLLEALTHVEECEECRLRIKSPSQAEVLNRIFGDELEPVENSAEEPGAGI